MMEWWNEAMQNGVTLTLMKPDSKMTHGAFNPTQLC